MTARTLRNLALAGAAAAILQAPILAHHSFAMYDQNKTVTITGAVKQYVPQANHAEFHLYVIANDRKGLEMGKDGKPVEFMVEMAGTAQLERQGVTAQTFPVGTVISVKVNPLRDGGPAGARVSALARCPADPATKKPKLPEAGKHCDSVPGRTLNGGETF
jgi:hypothetical protein